MSETDPYRRVTKKFQNKKMFILGEYRVIPEITMSITPRDKRWALSFDEYNRICDDIHEELKRKRKVRYK